MLNRRRILSVIVGVVFVFALPGDGKSATELEGRAERFVRSLAQEAVESLTTKGISHEVRIKRFRKMFNENFAVRAIGKFVLGRHWARATDAEREEYLFLFEDLMVGSYVDRFQRYTGEKLRILRTLPERTNAVSVFTEIVRSGTAKPIKVLWRIGAKDDALKVLDVLVGGASMSIILRSDFDSIIRQNEGRISGLLEELRIKTKSLKAPGAN